MTIHKCSYCEATASGTRDSLQDIGWSFADFRAPVRKSVKTCPEHYKAFNDEIKLIIKIKTVKRKKL